MKNRNFEVVLINDEDAFDAKLAAPEKDTCIVDYCSGCTTEDTCYVDFTG